MLNFNASSCVFYSILCTASSQHFLCLFCLLSCIFFNDRYHNLVSYLWRMGGEWEGRRDGGRKEGGRPSAWPLTAQLEGLHSLICHVKCILGVQKYDVHVCGLEFCNVVLLVNSTHLLLNARYQRWTLTVKEPRRKLKPWMIDCIPRNEKHVLELWCQLHKD